MEENFEELFSRYKDLCAQYEVSKAAEHLSEAKAASLGREAKLILDFSARQRALEEEATRLREENAILAKARAADNEEERDELAKLKAENEKLAQAKAVVEEERDALEEKLVVSRGNYSKAMNEVELITEQLKMAEHKLQDANEVITALEQRKSRRRSGSQLGNDSDSSMDMGSHSLSGKELKKKRERSFVLDHFERALTGADEEHNAGDSVIEKKKRKIGDTNNDNDNKKKSSGKSKEETNNSLTLSFDKSPPEKKNKKINSKPFLLVTPDRVDTRNSVDGTNSGSSSKNNSNSTTPTAEKSKKSVKRKGMNYASFLQQNKGLTVPKIKSN